MSELPKIKFGAHYADDGETWVGNKNDVGLVFERLANGSVGVDAGDMWEQHLITLSSDQVDQLRAWLEAGAAK